LPAVELRNATKVFSGGIKAVDEVSLQFPEGHVVALLGPSGSGKTTILRLINRLEEATSGEVLVRNTPVGSQPPERLRRSIGYVIQEGGLFPHVCVSTNVATVPRLLGWPRRRIRQRVAVVLELVGLPESQYGARMPAELSGGQRQRVGVARALAADPDILLMDEPFGALDPGTRESIQAEFLRLNAKLKKTVVLVTHDIVEASRLAEEIVLLERGRVVQRGTLYDLLLHPKDERVRGYLGSQGHHLALSVLRLRHIIQDVSVETSSRHVSNVPNNSIRLTVDLPLGQALVALADANDDTPVTLEGDAGTTYSAGPLKSRILADLKVAANGNHHAQ
jgi:osmoprotectant transport system ATP-binding protein